MWQCVTFGHAHVIPRDLFEPYLKYVSQFMALSDLLGLAQRPKPAEPSRMGRPRAWASDLKAGTGRPGRRPGSYVGPSLYASPDSTPTYTARYSCTLLNAPNALRRSVTVHIQSPPIFVIATRKPVFSHEYFPQYASQI